VSTLSLLAFVAIVIAVAGMATGAFATTRGIQPPEPCPRQCGCPAGTGHQCGR
jgi:hypothetical protein